MRKAATRFALLAAVLFAAVVYARGELSSQRDVRLQELPAEAHRTLALIRLGGPFPFDRDGITFGNYEKHLPARPRGHYREYTVITPGLSHRGARRIVVGCERQRGAGGQAGPLRLPQCRDGGEFYYTADHYRSFRRIVE
jgi:ribonuclease T1